MNAETNEKSVPVSIRLTPEVRSMMLKLVDMMSTELKIKISKSQAMEIAIREAFEKRSNNIN